MAATSASTAAQFLSVAEAKAAVTGYYPETHKTMPHRYLGGTGLKVSVLGFGAWVTFGQQYGDEVAYECMKAAYDGGCNFFDNAEVYASGQAEEVMGRAIKRMIEKDNIRRENLVITTKIYWGGDGKNQNGLSRKHIVEGLNLCLKRLQLDYVDVVFAHRPDIETPIEETVRAFSFVIDQGKAFYWGTSEWSADQIEFAISYAKAHNLHAPVVEQPQYNMFHRRKLEQEYLRLFKDYRFGTTIWSPLASGILSGKYNQSQKGTVPSDTRIGTSSDWGLSALKDALNKGNDGLWIEEKSAEVVHAKLEKLKPIADRLGATLAQLALAWAASNPNVSVVLTGASKASQVVENFKSVAIFEALTPSVLKEIDDILGNKPEVPRKFR